MVETEAQFDKEQLKTKPKLNTEYWKQQKRMLHGVSQNGNGRQVSSMYKRKQHEGIQQNENSRKGSYMKYVRMKEVQGFT